MIKFEAVRWKNFLSTGNVYTEIRLDKSPTTIITGENGAGKSTILDALCWVLFNKPFRNIRMLQLINTINQRDTRAEIEFSIGGAKYKVIRGYKPSVFEIWKNDTLLPQPGNVKDYQRILEDTILKLNYKSFTQIVVLGNASFTPFMQLSIRDRREVIEDLLDIQIFSSMNLLLKDRLSTNRQNLNDATYQIDLIKEKISIQDNYLSKIKSDMKTQIKTLTDEAEDYLKEYEKTTDEMNDMTQLLENLAQGLNGQDSTTDKSQKVFELITKLKDKHSKAHKRISFFEENDSCPTCEQIIEIESKAKQIETTTKSIQETEDALQQLQQNYHQLQDRITGYQELQKKIYDNEREYASLVAQSVSFRNNYEKAMKKINELKEEKFDNNDASHEIVRLKKEFQHQEKRKEELVNEKRIYEIASGMLRDGGIKTKIIRQYVPIMNKLVNKYLASLDFFVNFELDEEFNEVIKSRHRDEFSYASFSEGEKLRIDLALLFTWRAIAKLKNSTNTNLLILDEVFDASLDTAGCDEFLKLLHDVSGETNVFVISHKGDILTDKFRSSIRFEKYKNFSRIAS